VFLLNAVMGISKLAVIRYIYFAVIVPLGEFITVTHAESNKFKRKIIFRVIIQGTHDVYFTLSKPLFLL
jgi:hypothetical protein